MPGYDYTLQTLLEIPYARGASTTPRTRSAFMLSAYMKQGRSRARPGRSLPGAGPALPRRVQEGTEGVRAHTATRSASFRTGVKEVVTLLGKSVKHSPRSILLPPHVLSIWPKLRPFPF